MKLICSECKNEVGLSNHPDLAAGQVVECDSCGITLLVKSLGDEIEIEIVEEGK